MRKQDGQIQLRFHLHLLKLVKQKTFPLLEDGVMHLHLRRLKTLLKLEERIGRRNIRRIYQSKRSLLLRV